MEEKKKKTATLLALNFFHIVNFSFIIMIILSVFFFAKKQLTKINNTNE
jgi:hypothetical protein